MLTFDDLNERQRAAASWDDGPLLVLAAPGSGKTAVLTLRVARLLQENEDYTILAVTFTHKAAAEMRDRVQQILGRSSDRAQLCTFHSFAGDILRQHGSHLGLRPDYAVLSLDDDRLAVLRILTDEPRSPLSKRANEIRESIDFGDAPLPDDPRDILRLFDRLFSESYDGGEEAPGLHLIPTWLPSLFTAYCDLLVARNQLDFGAMLYLARRLLLQRPRIARDLRIAFTHFCVDEFQDTNRAQYDLLRLVVGSDKPNLFVVADGDQLIYQWNGASPERLEALREDFDMELIQFPESYRCPPAVVELANALILHNHRRSPGKQSLVAVASPRAGNVIRCHNFDDESEEVAFIAKDIRDRGLNPGDCVVLARGARLLNRAVEALNAASLEAHLVRRKSEFAEPVTRWMFELLRLANARHDREVLRRVCVHWERLTDVMIQAEDVASDATLLNGDFLRAWLEAAGPEDLAPEPRRLLEACGADLLGQVDVVAMVHWFLEQGVDDWEDDPLVQDEVDAWKTLHDDVLAQRGEGNITLHMYLQDAGMRPKAAPPPDAAVRCSTIHGAKGLEFEHVWLIGLADEVFPSYFAVKKGRHGREMEEERRSCFVAITRVQKTLTLTWARQYSGWAKEPSPFLSEMGLGRMK